MIRIVALIMLLGLVLPSMLQAQSVSYDSAILSPIENTMVAAESPGVVRLIHIATGDDVQAGAQIVSLNREIFEAELRVAIGEYEIAKLQAANDVDIRFAQKSADVNQKLWNRSSNARSRYVKSVTATEIDRLRLEFEQAELSTEQALLEKEIAGKTAVLRRNMKDVAEVKVNNREIRAPLDGRVAQLFVQKGQWVNAGEPIARIVNLKKLRVQAVFTKDLIFKIKKGSQAKFVYSIGDDEFAVPVEISYVGSEIDEGQFQVWADVDNSQLELIPGVLGRLAITLED